MCTKTLCLSFSKPCMRGGERFMDQKASEYAMLKVTNKLHVQKRSIDE